MLPFEATSSSSTLNSRGIQFCLLLSQSRRVIAGIFCLDCGKRLQTAVLTGAKRESTSNSKRLIFCRPTHHSILPLAWWTNSWLKKLLRELYTDGSFLNGCFYNAARAVSNMEPEACESEKSLLRNMKIVVPVFQMISRSLVRKSRLLCFYLSSTVLMIRCKHLRRQIHRCLL